MSVIYYSLRSVTALTPFVSAAGDDGAWTLAVNNLPAAANQFYVIVNTATDLSSSYVGTAEVLQNRFAPRQEAAVTLGISASYMRHVAVWYGGCQAWDTPSLTSPVQSAVNLYTGSIASNLLGAPRGVADFQAQLDNYPYPGVDLEKLLIRMYNRPDAQCNTNTNTMLSKTPYRNETGNAISIYVDISAGGTLAGNVTVNHVIQPGDQY